MGAVIVGAGEFFNSRREQIVALATRQRVPAMYQYRDFADVGGLISYGPSLSDAYRQTGVYTVGFSRARSPSTCQFCDRPSLSWSST